MIIKSHIRGGYRAAAQYLKETGQNELVRLVEISDPLASNLDDAFRNMWAVGSTTRAKKPLHHVSINPRKDECLTDQQVFRICERLEEKYGYERGQHQRVIVEHIKDSRQHFHVIWNRINLRTGRPVWPGEHWNKSKQAAREMERELGLSRPLPRRSSRTRCRNKPQRRTAHGRSRRRRHRRFARDCAIGARGYLRICQHPLRDLRLWLDTAYPRGGWTRTNVGLVPARPPAGFSLHDLLRSIRRASAGERLER
jgi:Relaxase/Mobilisation nuclease domain